MCLINLQFRDHPTYKLIVAANRDEFYGRPAAPAHFWEDEPYILAGRDLTGMGTWLGVTKQGRIAALTNFRDPTNLEAGRLSRGAVVKDFLAGTHSPKEYLQSINAKQYAGFNVIIGDAERLFYYNNIQEESYEIPPGTHGLSNHFLNTPWPKVTKGKEKLASYMAQTDRVDLEKIFTILADGDHAPDTHLPDTGVGLDLERMLSPMFIKTPDYGTRSATVILVAHDGSLTFAERNYEKGLFKEDNRFEFKIE
ncbi:NRDE family protein [Planococcus sp. ISL-110]|uniref:NRDE family protein n=1 Tax=Planococcus sp. ISL-110 TaxID=2819167 RepID=UPI001BE5F711|nr:NRDE family protein [Planococcus sp. ISL-110]MBT2571204.1 NRDE family protein [Planococcus sp. ISL-110]